MRRRPSRTAVLRTSAGAAFAAVLATTLDLPRPASAAPLDADSCGRLKSDLSSLEAAGVRADMAKGPADAKARLPQARLQQIARLIEIEGQLRFRCPLDKPFVVLKEPPPEEGEAPVKIPVPKKKTAAKQPEKQADGEAPKKQPRPARKEPAKEAGEGKGAAPVKKAAAPAEQPARPKAKADDAYRPAPVKKADQ